MKVISFIFLCFFLTSCSQDVWMEYQFNIDNGNDFSDVQKREINEILRTKLDKFGFRTAQIHNERNLLKVKVLINPSYEGEEDAFLSVFKSNELKILETYRVNDAELMKYNMSMLLEPHFTPYFELASDVYLEEVFGVSQQQDKLQEIKDNLSAKIQLKSDMKFYWSEEVRENLDGIKNYELYLVKEPRISGGNLTEFDVDQFIPRKDYQDDIYMITFTFNKEATKKWEEITQRAANNGNRCIALIVNNRVVSAPAVRMPIVNGRCALSGDFNREEAEKLALYLSVGRLDYALTYMSKSTIEK